MKRSTVPAIGFACVLAAAGTMPLSVLADGSDAMCAEIAAEISQPGVCVSESDGVITLTGNVESAIDKEAAERAAKKMAAGREVRNMILVSD